MTLNNYFKCKWINMPNQEAKSGWVTWKNEDLVIDWLEEMYFRYQVR